MTPIQRVMAAIAVGAITLVTGCQLGSTGPSTGETSSSPSASNAASQSSSALPAGCVTPPVDFGDMVGVQQSEIVDPVACYCAAPLTFDAQWLNPGIADCPTAPEPAWLACSGYSLRAVGETGKVGVPELFVAIDPSITAFPDAGTTVRVTGHFDDPAAQTCHDTFALPDASPEPAETVIARCERQFVVTGVTWAGD